MVKHCCRAPQAEADENGGAAASAGQDGGSGRGGGWGGRGGGRGGPPPPPPSGHVKHMLGAVAALTTQDRFELRPGTHGLMGRRSPPRGGQVG